MVDEEHLPRRPKRWVACSIEEEYFGDERKVGKKERRIASTKDRSKFKKTDRDKIQKKAALTSKDLEKFQLGKVVSVASQGVMVAFADKIYCCSLRGLLKKEKGQLKNLVIVGDWVYFEPLTEDEGVIHEVEARKTVLSRADNLSRRKEQLIASNIDQVLITVSVVSPPLKPFLVDRYIIATRKGGMEPIVVINKIDLLDDPAFDIELRLQEKALLEEFERAYLHDGVPVIPISATTGEGLEAMKRLMVGKSSVFSGQSGVGKSSLISMVADTVLPVGPIVTKTQKGAHTTSNASLLPLPFGGWCIDTPGIKSFGIWNLEEDEIEAYFTEIFTCGRMCKYPDCSHTQEQGCAVLKAVEAGEISLMRYRSYQYLLESIRQEHLRR